MYNIRITEGQHEWEKQNTITVFKGNKHFDIMKCKKCGITGRTTSLAEISLKGSYAHDNVYFCKGNRINDVPVEIQIKKVHAFGPAFKNLSPGSNHIVIEPPKGYKNDHTGVWIMGVGEPVKVLSDEFTIVR